MAPSLCAISVCLNTRGTDKSPQNKHTFPGDCNSSSIYPQSCGGKCVDSYYLGIANGVLSAVNNIQLQIMLLGVSLLLTSMPGFWFGMYK